MNKSESITKLAPALVKAQTKIGGAAKGAANPFFKSKYADLGSVMEAVKQPLLDQGISFLQIVGFHGTGNSYVETVLLHESGEYISGQTPIIVAKTNDPQALGSAITYAKRYGLQAMLGVPSEDDDGEKAMGRSFKTPILKKDKVDAPRGDSFDL